MKNKLAMLSGKRRTDEMAKHGHLECPRSKKGYNRYEIQCVNCGSILGYVWADSPNLNDWFDFHYYQYTDGEYWYGAITPNISPIDGSLGIECSCGIDTRDFRANMTLPFRAVDRIEKKNAVGREFGTKDSKFVAVPVDAKTGIISLEEHLKWQR